MQEIHATIEGNVQGVFFRQTTRKQAKVFGLTGWVKNKDDGSVEVVAQGEEAQLEKFIEFLEEGPRRAEVKDIEIEWQDPAEEFEVFEIRYS